MHRCRNQVIIQIKIRMTEHQDEWNLTEYKRPNSQETVKIIDILIR